MAKGGLLLTVALLGLQRTPANAFLNMPAIMKGAASAARGWVCAPGEGGMRRIGMLRAARRSGGLGGSYMTTGVGRSSAEVILVGSGVGGVEYLTVPSLSHSNGTPAPQNLLNPRCDPGSSLCVRVRAETATAAPPVHFPKHVRAIAFGEQHHGHPNA